MVILTELLPYQTALLALSILVLAVLVQAVLTAPLAFVSEEQAPGAPLQGNHELRSFRVIRTHANSVENLPPFGFALFAAIAGGASAELVNWTACLHLVFRLLFWGIYYAGVGKVAGGPRTLCFVGGLVTNGVLASSAVIAFI